MDRAPGRALGLDLGSRRIGVALSDSARTIASPHAVLERSGELSRDRQRIAALAEESGATVCVVGLPLSLNGSVGPAAQGALDEADALAALLEIPVVTADERLTTVEVERRRLERAALEDAPRRGGRGARRQSGYGATKSRARPVVDDAAAAVMLQAWLDASRTRGGL